jgi:hypothetical protein
LDFYHAAEHLSLLAQALYGADPQRCKTQAKLWRDMLLEDRLADALTGARDSLPDIPEPRHAAEGQIAYFQTNSSRMTYGTFRSQGLFIGSGIIESECSAATCSTFMSASCQQRIRKRRS